jgi:predicted dehydrogenase
MRFKIGIIGHTGRGNYGHYLDMAFVGVEGADIVAVADPDETGRAAVAERTGAAAAYADYREMLEKEKPDIAVVASREVGDHRDYVVNTAAAGAHIYMEKPSAASPEQIDEMISACNKTSVQCVVAHPWRAHPPTQQVAIPLIKEGKIGEPRLARIYGMGGKHGGCELFLDLYPHFFDLLWQLFGAPQWCHAHLTQDGRTCEPADLRQTDEGMGLSAGNGIKAYYCYEDGFAADFESYQGDGKENPYRIDFHGTEGTLSMPGPMSNSPDIYFHPLANPGLMMDDRWEVVPSDPPPTDDKWVKAHHRSARSMMDMLAGNKPQWDLVQLEHARNLLEMALLAHASHMQGARVSLPLSDGKNPFDHWS